MTDLWEDEGFGSAGAPPDEGDESLESALEDQLDDPAELDDDDRDEGEE